MNEVKQSFGLLMLKVDYLSTADAKNEIIKSVFEAVSKQYSLTLDTITYNRNRRRNVVSARQMAWYILRTHFPKIPDWKIAEFCNMDRSTVVSGAQMCENNIDTDYCANVIVTDGKQWIYKDYPKKEYETLKQVLNLH